MLKFIQDQILGMKWLETPAYELSTKRQDRHNRFCFFVFPGRLHPHVRGRLRRDSAVRLQLQRLAMTWNTNHRHGAFAFQAPDRERSAAHPLQALFDISESDVKPLILF